MYCKENIVKSYCKENNWYAKFVYATHLKARLITDGVPPGESQVRER